MYVWDSMCNGEKMIKIETKLNILYVFMYVCMYVCVCVCVYACIMYACMYAFMGLVCVCMYM